MTSWNTWRRVTRRREPPGTCRDSAGRSAHRPVNRIPSTAAAATNGSPNAKSSARSSHAPEFLSRTGHRSPCGIRAPQHGHSPQSGRTARRFPAPSHHCGSFASSRSRLRGQPRRERSGTGSRVSKALVPHSWDGCRDRASPPRRTAATPRCWVPGLLPGGCCTVQFRMVSRPTRHQYTGCAIPAQPAREARQALQSVKATGKMAG